MSLLSNTTDLFGFESNSRFWTQKRLLILHAIEAVKQGQNDIPKSVHRKLCQKVKNLFTENGRKKSDLSVEDLKDINEVLSFLEEQNWNCRFLNIPEKRERPSTCPSNEKELIAFHALRILREQTWSKIALGELNTLQEKVISLITSAVLEIACNSGLQLPQLIDAISNLNSLDQAPCYLTVKVHPKANENAVVLLPLSSKAYLILSALYQEKSKAKGIQTSVFPNTRKKVLKLISLALQNCPEIPALSDGCPPKAKDVLQAAQYNLGFNGIEPIIQSRLGGDILPISPPKSSDGFQFLNESISRQWPTILKRGKPPTVPSPSNQNITEPNRLDHALDSRIVEQYFWNEICRREMRKTLNRFRLSLTDETGKYHNGLLNPDDVQEALFGLKGRCIQEFKASAQTEIHNDKIDEFNETIDRLNNSFTNIDLAIRWAQYRLIDQRVTLDTFRQDVSNLFNHGFFQYSAAYNLTTWDEEDAEILVSDYLLNRKLSNKTINRIVNSLASLCKYSRDNLNIFSDVHFPLEFYKSGLALTRRSNIFGLLELDLVTSEVMEEEKDGEKLACILDLAFYAGLRSGEITNLTLNSIVTNENETIIYLPRFKTPSAYRSIPLHHLAPPDVCRRVQNVVAKRHIQLRKFNNKPGKKVKLKQCYLFSTDGKVDDCSSPEMICMARNLLKIKSGEGADLHLLRHSFASHIFLRWYCCRYEDLILQLLEKDHWCFSIEGINNLKRIFSEKPDSPLPPTNITSIIHILKLMGHKTTTTLFRVYVHSFEVVAQHALEKCFKEGDLEIMSGKAIAALIPNCRSRTSQAKINDKSFAGLAKWILSQ